MRVEEELSTDGYGKGGVGWDLEVLRRVSGERGEMRMGITWRNYTTSLFTIQFITSLPEYLILIVTFHPCQSQG